MCSRFELNSTAAELARQFRLPDPPPMSNMGEFRPTDQVLVLNAPGGGSNRAWGVPAPWDGKPIFNARAETLSEKPTFRTYLAGRCLVPASAYFEWKKDGKVRSKMRIQPSTPTQIPFAFAGLADKSHVTIVTCQAVPSIAEVHGRMPVLLDLERAAAWIDREKTLDDVAQLFEPLDLGDLQAEIANPLSESPAQADLFA